MNGILQESSPTVSSPESVLDVIASPKDFDLPIPEAGAPDPVVIATDGSSLPDTVSGSDAVPLPENEASVSGEVPSSFNGVVPEVDYDAVYDTFYSASYDALEAYSQSVTDGQQVSSTALSYFQGILNNMFFPADYVIWVGDDYRYNNQTYYEYCMAYGDLMQDGTYFSGTGTVVTMRVNGNRSVSYAYDQTISLNAPMYYSRSNLGDYSGVVTYDWTGLLILIILMLGGVVWFMKKLLRIG